MIAAADARIKAMRVRSRLRLPRTAVEEFALLAVIVAGLVLIVLGIGRIYGPAGLIAAGLLLVALALAYYRGEQ